MSDFYTSVEGRQAVHGRYAEMLGGWPVPSEQCHVPTREGETFVVAWGPAYAPPVLLLQGSGANVAMWMRDVAVWAEHHRVYAVDVIGEPGFSAPSRPPLGSDAYALWLDDVMQALGLTRASFVGVSLGGWMVLDYAMRRVDRVEKVVVVNPSGIGRQRASFMFKIGGFMLLGRWGRRKAMALAIGPAPGRAHPLDREIGMLALLISKHFQRRRVNVPIFGDEELRRLTMPVLAIVGAQDALLDSHGTKRRLEQLAPRVTVRWLPGVGHVVRDQTSAVLDFLRQ
ncbi:MAG TPA: alpha/beta fold hydrolase [Thermoanaerobaculia bacterium]|jgi:pimeloyl-ACP methyl ester carboxylesterase